jgi:hypothetical protein
MVLRYMFISSLGCNSKETTRSRPLLGIILIILMMSTASSSSVAPTRLLLTPPLILVEEQQQLPHRAAVENDNDDGPTFTIDEREVNPKFGRRKEIVYNNRNRTTEDEFDGSISLNISWLIRKKGHAKAFRIDNMYETVVGNCTFCDRQLVSCIRTAYAVSGPATFNPILCKSCLAYMFDNTVFTEAEQKLMDQRDLEVTAFASESVKAQMRTLEQELNAIEVASRRMCSMLNGNNGPQDG